MPNALTLSVLAALAAAPGTASASPMPSPAPSAAPQPFACFAAHGCPDVQHVAICFAGRSPAHGASDCPTMRRRVRFAQPPPSGTAPQRPTPSTPPHR